MSITPNDPRILDTTNIEGRYLSVHSLRGVTGVNLNAGEDGAPKQMMLGTSNRMRVSSQSRKRAMRAWGHQFMGEGEQAMRTRHIPNHVARELANVGRDLDEAISTVAGCLASIGDGFTITPSTIGRTEEIAFVPATAVANLAAVIDAAWNDLADVRANVAAQRLEAAKTQAEAEASGEGKKKARPAKGEKVKIARQTLPVTLRKALEAAYAPGANLDLAIYGRMLTSLPAGGTITAAASVAHSYSVDPINLISDAWSVKDDWQDAGVFGAAHYADGRDARILASGTLYEWSTLDRHQLRTNLAAAYPEQTDPDGKLLDEACANAERLFVSASAWAIPQAASHTTGSMTPPTFVIATGSDTQPVTADCFVSAITGDNPAVDAATRLSTYLTNTQRFLPTHGGLALWLPPTGETAPTLPDGITLL